MTQPKPRAPFPWDPNGFIRPSVEHLFVPPKPGKWAQANRAPSTYRAPGPACQFTIFPTVPVDTRKKALMAQI